MWKLRHRNEVTFPTLYLEAFKALSFICCLEDPGESGQNCLTPCSMERFWRSVMWKMDQLCPQIGDKEQAVADEEEQ